jgi:hypothetical protein
LSGVDGGETTWGRSVRKREQGTRSYGAGWGMALVLYHQGRKRQGPRERASKGERGGRAEQGKGKGKGALLSGHRVTESQADRLPSSIRFRSQADAGTNNSIQLERGTLAARRARSRIARQGCLLVVVVVERAVVSAELPLVCQAWMDAALLASLRLVWQSARSAPSIRRRRSEGEGRKIK